MDRRQVYKCTPTELRKLARQPAAADPDCYRFRLAYRPPYQWHTVLAFLGARATPGVESIEDSHYRRTIQIDGKNGEIDVSHPPSGSCLQLDVRFSDPRSLLLIVERVRRVFDLDADPAVIGAHLQTDPLLRSLLATHPGIRTPGAWDGFEIAVRAILGQQVSVRAATTLAGRIAAGFGSPVSEACGLAHLFPTPAQLGDAAIERLGVMPSRAQTIRALARCVTSGTLTFGSGADPRATVQTLETIHGIGAWTAQYIAMRALNEPDAFPRGDLVLRRAVGGCTARQLDDRSERWRPWRAYAVMLLWQGSTDDDTLRRMQHATVDRNPERRGGTRDPLDVGAALITK